MRKINNNKRRVRMYQYCAKIDNDGIHMVTSYDGRCKTLGFCRKTGVFGTIVGDTVAELQSILMKERKTMTKNTIRSYILLIRDLRNL